MYEDRSRSILSQNDSPDVGFRYGVNPYRGCQHACSYCYARPTHEYLGLGAGTDFDRKILVKRDAPALLETAFRRRSWRGEMVAFSGITDCYQPLEAGFELTRRCLEVCLAFHNPVQVITKSRLVQRDVDVISALARSAAAFVFISIPFADPAMCRVFEPGAPPPERRFETLRTLHEAGIPVGVSMSPIIPGINDPDIPSVLERARECGASHAFKILLRLPGNTRNVFLDRLDRMLPDRAARVRSRIQELRDGRWNDSRLGHRGVGTGPYWEAIEQSWKIRTRKLGYATEWIDIGPGPAFQRPPTPGDAAQGRFW